MKETSVGSAAFAQYQKAAVAPLLDVPDTAPAVHSLEWIRMRLPQTEPFLFVDAVQAVIGGIICGRFDVQKHSQIFAAHFPGCPCWPGVLQIEAMTQVASLLCQSEVPNDGPPRRLALVHAARFMRVVLPDAPVQLLGTSFDEGLFTVLVGQTVQRGRVCSACVVSIV